jgi:hypothetical protein
MPVTACVLARKYRRLIHIPMLGYEADPCHPLGDDAMFRPRCVTVVLLACVIALGSIDARADSARLILNSQPGNFVGGGKHSDVTYTLENTLPGWFAHNIGGTIGGEPVTLSFTFLLKDPISGDIASPDEFASLDFSTEQLGIPFAPGTYTDAQRASFADPGHPGLDVSFEHRGSNIVFGQFTVNSVSFYRDSSNTLQIGSLDVNFEQHSEQPTSPALFGHFTYQSSAAVPEPSSLALVSLGLAGAAVLARRRRTC